MGQSKTAMPTPYNCKLFMKYVGIFLLFFFLLIPTAGRTEDGNTAKSSSSKTEAIEIEKFRQKNNLVDFLFYITDLSKRFVELESQIDASSIQSRFQEELSQISSQMQFLSQQVSAISANAEMKHEQFEIIKTKIYKLGYQIKRVKTPLFRIIETLSSLNTEWAEKKENLGHWTKIAEDEVSLQLVKEDIIRQQRKVDLALELISEKLKPALAAQKKAFELEIKIHSLILIIEKHTQEFQKKSVKKTGSIFSSDSYSQIDKDLLVTIWKNTIVAVISKWQLFADQFKSIFILCLLIFSLLFFIHRSKKLVKTSDDWYLFTVRPLASAIFLCLASLMLLDFFTENDIQIYNRWETMWRIILLVSIVRLSGALLEVSWKKIFFSMIIISMTLIESFKLLNLPQVIFYIYTFFAAILILIFCLWRIRRLSKQKISFAELLGLRLSAFILFGILVMVISGFQDSALYLFFSLLAILSFSFIAWVLIFAAKSFLELLLLAIPLKVARNNSSYIVSHITPVIIIFFSYVVFIRTLQFLDVFPTKEAAMESLHSFDLAAGAWVISPSTLLWTVITIYGIFLFSKTIQGLLLQEVLPRYNAAKGVQFSIVRLVNYAILSFGFLLVLHVLGFELKSLTIFGGALGIGIGFGLQAIVTNVVGGLILLFERPIKVGDMVQVGNEFGEIKKVGLRATVVQTFDNAEIVIPNSDLITGPVTNWTLSERQSRVRVPVGVAYGTDTTKVLEILMSCADESPMVLSDPSPTALFLSFGESSLDFELRVWSPEVNDRMMVLSELNQQINDEFKLAGIEIPFPQRDLHLRSASEAVTELQSE